MSKGFPVMAKTDHVTLEEMGMTATEQDLIAQWKKTPGMSHLTQDQMERQARAHLNAALDRELDNRIAGMDPMEAELQADREFLSPSTRIDPADPDPETSS